MAATSPAKRLCVVNDDTDDFARGSPENPIDVDAAEPGVTVVTVPLVVDPAAVAATAAAAAAEQQRAVELMPHDVQRGEWMQAKPDEQRVKQLAKDWPLKAAQSPARVKFVQLCCDLQHAVRISPSGVAWMPPAELDKAADSLRGADADRLSEDVINTSLVTAAIAVLTAANASFRLSESQPGTPAEEIARFRAECAAADEAKRAAEAAAEAESGFRPAVAVEHEAHIKRYSSKFTCAGPDDEELKLRTRIDDASHDNDEDLKQEATLSRICFDHSKFFGLTCGNLTRSELEQAVRCVELFKGWLQMQDDYNEYSMADMLKGVKTACSNPLIHRNRSIGRVYRRRQALLRCFQCLCMTKNLPLFTAQVFADHQSMHVDDVWAPDHHVDDVWASDHQQVGKDKLPKLKDIDTFDDADYLDDEDEEEEDEEDEEEEEEDEKEDSEDDE
jgi:hypothetical protein